MFKGHYFKCDLCKRRLGNNTDRVFTNSVSRMKKQPYVFKHFHRKCLEKQPRLAIMIMMGKKEVR